MSDAAVPNGAEQAPCYPDLVGKVAVVTGGSRGIGAATSRLLARNGVKVAVVGRDTTALREVITTIERDGGRALDVCADCVDFAALERVRERTEEALGPIDVLVPFAGGYGEPDPTAGMTEERWRFVVDANLTATFLTIRSMLPGMLARGTGSIITMASSAGRLPSPASAAYAAAKAGIIMLTRHLAAEVGRQGVRINCVAPSAIRTERMERLMSGLQLQQLASAFPLGRVGRPEDVASATLFLASESASWLTGVTLDIAGGRIIV